MENGCSWRAWLAGLLAVGAVARASAVEMYVTSSFEMLPDYNAITCPHKARDGIRPNNCCHFYKYGAEECRKEEEYHLKQWLGEVSESEGGQIDCCTAEGVRFYCSEISDPSVLPIVYDLSADLVHAKACAYVHAAENAEKDTALNIALREERRFIEVKAKAAANYNAAWKYHCTYEEGGKYPPSLQSNIKHPAYR
jgi:hypothetical protein